MQLRVPRGTLSSLTVVSDKSEKNIIMIKKVLMPLPHYGFDPTEVAIPWKILHENNVAVSFATPDGKKANADETMLTGKGLGIWKYLLKARQDAVNACKELESSPSFNNPISYKDISYEEYDGLVLPGGHDKRVKDYLESKVLQSEVVRFFKAEKAVAAICHGVVVAARSINAETGQSVLYDYKTTSLLQSQEQAAYNLTRLWMGNYYLTYPEITVEDEVKSVLASIDNFITGPKPLLRDSASNLKRGFVVKDRHYISARWPGDVYNFSFEFLQLLHADEYTHDT